jgi:hypothetical protein
MRASSLSQVGSFSLRGTQAPASGDVDTGGTLAIEDHIMAFKQKAGRCQRLHVLGTALNFVDLPTGTALEMMMMGLRGSLITGRLTGKLNLDEPPFCNETLESAIDCGNPQTRGVPLCNLEHFLRTQRTTSFFDNAPDGPALASIAFHGKMVHRIRYHLQCQWMVDRR